MIRYTCIHPYDHGINKRPFKTTISTIQKGSNMLLLTYGSDTNYKET